MSNATGTAAVIKAAHAEVVATAVVAPVEVIVYNLPVIEKIVARPPSFPRFKAIPQGYNYHYNHAPGASFENFSCMNAGASSGSWRFDVVGEAN